MKKTTNIMMEWNEFNPSAKKSMKDDFGNSPSKFQEKILTYLENGELLLASPSLLTDVFTGKNIKKTNCILTDGEYSWSSSLSYYIYKYNLNLPRQFEEKIINE